MADLLTLWDKPGTFKDIQGNLQGMDQRDTTVIPDTRAANMETCDLTIEDIVQKFPGRTAFATGLDAAAVQAMRMFNPDGGTKLMIACANGKLWKVASDGTASSLATGFTDENTWLVQAANKMFQFKQNDPVNYYDGTSVTPLADDNTHPPKAKGAIYFLRWLLPFADKTNLSGIYFGNNGDVLNGWNRSVNLLQINDGDGGQIMTVKPWTNQDMMVFKDNRIFAVTVNASNPASWPVLPVTDDIGCWSGRSVVQYGEDILFLAQDGIRRLTQSMQDKKRGASVPLSHPRIESFIKSINWTAAWEKAAATVWRNMYILAVPTGASLFNNELIVYDFVRDAFHLIPSRNVSAFAGVTFNNIMRMYTGGSDSTGGIYQEDNGFDNAGTAVTWRLESKAFNLDQPHIWKRHGELKSFFKATGNFNVNVYARVDGGSYTSIGTLNLQGNLPTLPIALPFDLGGESDASGNMSIVGMGRWHKIQFKWECSDAGADIQFQRAVFRVLPQEYSKVR